MAKATTATNIMPTTWTNPLPVWVIGVLGLCLVAMAAPPLVARMVLLPGDPLRAELRAGRSLSAADLAILEASRLRVAGWFPKGEVIDDLALLALTRGRLALTAPERKEFFTLARERQGLALALSPIDPHGWFRLATLYIMEDGRPTARSAAAWTQSMSVAPYEPSMMIARLQMGMAHGALIGAEGAAYIPSLVRGSAIFDADALARIAKEGGFASTVENVLQNDPAALAAFRKQLAK